jgi:hypothetical protein
MYHHFPLLNFSGISYQILFENKSSLSVLSCLCWVKLSSTIGPKIPFLYEATKKKWLQDIKDFSCPLWIWIIARPIWVMGPPWWRFHHYIILHEWLTVYHIPPRYHIIADHSPNSRANVSETASVPAQWRLPCASLAGVGSQEGVSIRGGRATSSEMRIVWKFIESNMRHCDMLW